MTGFFLSGLVEIPAGFISIALLVRFFNIGSKSNQTGIPRSDLPGQEDGLRGLSNSTSSVYDLRSLLTS